MPAYGVYCLSFLLSLSTVNRACGSFTDRLSIELPERRWKYSYTPRTHDIKPGHSWQPLTESDSQNQKVLGSCNKPTLPAKPRPVRSRCREGLPNISNHSSPNYSVTREPPRLGTEYRPHINTRTGLNLSSKRDTAPHAGPLGSCPLILIVARSRKPPTSPNDRIVPKVWPRPDTNGARERDHTSGHIGLFTQKKKKG